MSKTQYKSLIDRNKQSSKGLHIVAGVRDNTDLSNKYSDLPSRTPLAFFTSKICVTSQVTKDSVNTSYPFTGVNRHKKDMLSFQHITVYEGEDIAKYNSLLGEYAGRYLYLPRVIPPLPMIIHSERKTQNNTGVTIHGC